LLAVESEIPFIHTLFFLAMSADPPTSVLQTKLNVTDPDRCRAGKCKGIDQGNNKKQ